MRSRLMSYAAAAMLALAPGLALAQQSSGTGNETNCSPGATNLGCNVSGTNKPTGPGTGNTTSQTNTGTGGNTSTSSHSTQETGSSRSGAETGLGNSAGGTSAR